MSESLSLAHVKTSPIPFGVKVEWLWPEHSDSNSRLEMQHLSSDGVLEKQIVNWPVEALQICGLKAGERLQIRLRIMGFNEITRDWRQADWIEGVSSTNAGDYLGETSSSWSVKGKLSCLSGCSDIVEETLSAVLIEILPRTAENKAVNVAKTMARAVRAAFDPLVPDDASQS